MLRLFLICLLAVWHFSAYAEAPLEWARLIHPTSGIKESDFYLSQERTPDSELAAFIRAWHSGDHELSCRFPARFRIAKKLGLIKGAAANCQRFQQWRNLIRAEKVELAFASAFINSPSSLYGHTFLKFPRAGETKGNELLDYSVSFGADTGSAGGFSYVFKGLTGGFPGVFSTAPFYLKVKEYGEMENRDIWIYPLNFSQEEVDLLIEHLWEIRDVKFPYYFLSKNCAYFLLEFLESARPNISLTKNFPLWSIPVDTIRLLKKEGLITGREYRPSLMTKILTKRALLNGDEREIVLAAATKKESIKDLAKIAGKQRSIATDLAYDLFRYRRGVVNENDPSAVAFEKSLLALQDKNKLEKINFSTTAPEEGHGSERLGALFGRSRSGNSFWELRYRGALHDILDNLEGYEPHSALAMGDLAVRFEQDKLLAEEIGVLKILSLAPSDAWIGRVAWNFSFSYDRIRWIPCVGWGCGAWNLDGGPGYSRRIFPNYNAVGYLFLNSAFRVGNPFLRHYQWDFGPKGGFFLPLGGRGRVFIEGERRISLMGGEKGKISYRVGGALNFTKDIELRVQGQRVRDYGEGSISLFRYF